VGKKGLNSLPCKKRGKRNQQEKRRLAGIDRRKGSGNASSNEREKSGWEQGFTQRTRLLPGVKKVADGHTEHRNVNKCRIGIRTWAPSAKKNGTTW